MPACIGMCVEFTAVWLLPATVVLPHKCRCSTRIMHALFHSVPSRCQDVDNGRNVPVLSICRFHSTGFINDLPVYLFQSKSLNFQFPSKYRPDNTVIMEISVWSTRIRYRPQFLYYKAPLSRTGAMSALAFWLVVIMEDGCFRCAIKTGPISVRGAHKFINWSISKLTAVVVWDASSQFLGWIHQRI